MSKIFGSVLQKLSQDTQDCSLTHVAEASRDRLFLLWSYALFIGSSDTWLLRSIRCVNNMSTCVTLSKGASLQAYSMHVSDIGRRYEKIYGRQKLSRKINFTLANEQLLKI